jgi:hypothetical protein
MRADSYGLCSLFCIVVVAGKALGRRLHTVKSPENEVLAKPNLPPPQFLSCWQPVIELWREVKMHMAFGLTNFNGIFSSTSPKWGIPNSGGAIDNDLRCNSSQFAKKCVGCCYLS